MLLSTNTIISSYLFYHGSMSLYAKCSVAPITRKLLTNCNHKTSLELQGTDICKAVDTSRNHARHSLTIISPMLRSLSSFSIMSHFDAMQTDYYFQSRHIHLTCTLLYDAALEKQFSHSKDYYKILGVKPGCTDKELRNSFMLLCKRYHPDNSESGDHNKFILVKEAYDVIKEPASRGQYDQFHEQSHPSGSPYFNRDEPPYPRYNPPYRNNGFPRRNPLTMEEQYNHINRVYDRLNREHEFNRSAYQQNNKWDMDSKAWSRKRSAQQRSFSKQEMIIKVCATVILIGILLNYLNYRLYLKRISHQTLYRSQLHSLDARHAKETTDSKKTVE